MATTRRSKVKTRQARAAAGSWLRRTLSYCIITNKAPPPKKCFGQVQQGGGDQLKVAANALGSERRHASGQATLVQTMSMHPWRRRFDTDKWLKAATGGARPMYRDGERGKGEGCG